MLQAVVRAIQLPDVRLRIMFTLGVLLLFRLIAHIPVPNIDPAALDQLQEALQQNQLAQLLNVFSGGALQNFSVAAMGVYPYITATIIMQLLQPVIPHLEELSKEGEQGRIKLNRYQMWLTVPLAMLQGYGQTVALETSLTGQSLFRTPFDLVGNFLPTFTIIMSMTAGTMLLVWLGEQINERGIGNGISIIIFGGIVSRVPSLVWEGVTIGQAGGTETVLGLLLFLFIGLITIVGIVYIQEGQRRIPVQYAKRVRGNKVYGGQSSHIPLKINMAGMIPLIFAQSVIIFPGVVASWFYNPNLVGSEGEGIGNQIAGFLVNTFSPTGAAGGLVYTLLLFLLVVGFTYFYTMVLFSQQNIPENLQKNGGFIPGIRPGKRTEEYLGKVLNRITLAGALALGLVAVMPFVAQSLTGVQIGLGAAALLIVVGVAIDTMRQLEAQLVMRNYEGFINR
jgi:preprotein translocase subunit SecY